MKKINYKKIFATLSFLFIQVSFLMASPKPMKRGSGGFVDDNQVGTAIDNYLIILFVVAMLVGVYFINKQYQKKIA